MNAEKKNHFYKMHGAGNDFILIDNHAGVFDRADHRKIKKMCAYHTGIGADGFMLISESEKNDFKLEYFNANGLPAEMCGNGARCAVFLAHRLKLAPSQCSFEIGDKQYQAEVLEDGFVRLRMESPQLLMDDVQMKFLGKPESKSMYWVEAGVPHLVIIVKDLPDKLDDMLVWGKHLRHHWMFRPRGTNVNFIYPFDKNHLQGRVYERGVEGETLACGTGAVACAFVAMKEYGWDSPINVHYPGGQLLVEFDADFQEVFLNGKIILTFEGEYDSGYFECI